MPTCSLVPTSASRPDSSLTSEDSKMEKVLLQFSKVNQYNTEYPLLSRIETVTDSMGGCFLRRQGASLLQSRQPLICDSLVLASGVLGYMYMLLLILLQGFPPFCLFRVLLYSPG